MVSTVLEIRTLVLLDMEFPALLLIRVPNIGNSNCCNHSRVCPVFPKTNQPSSYITAKFENGFLAVQLPQKLSRLSAEYHKDNI